MLDTVAAFQEASEFLDLLMAVREGYGRHWWARFKTSTQDGRSISDLLVKELRRRYGKKDAYARNFITDIVSTCLVTIVTSLVSQEDQEVDC